MGVTFIASTSQVLWRVLESYALDPAPLFRNAGLDPQRWTEPDARFGNAELDAAWKLAESQVAYRNQELRRWSAEMTRWLEERPKKD